MIREIKTRLLKQRTNIYIMGIMILVAILSILILSSEPHKQALDPLNISDVDLTSSESTSTIITTIPNTSISPTTTSFKASTTKIINQTTIYQKEVDITETQIITEITIETESKQEDLEQYIETESIEETYVEEDSIVEDYTEETVAENLESDNSSSNRVYIGEFKITHYCPCSSCCGVNTGITASGSVATAGRTIGMSSSYSFGTQVEINGLVYIVEDRGGFAENTIDIYCDSHEEAIEKGTYYTDVYQIVE